jgi:hypothetical protein
MFNPHPDFKMSLIIGKRDDELDLNEGTVALMEFKDKVIKTEAQDRTKIPFPLSNGTIFYDVFGQPLYNTKGRIIGAATVSTELQT